MGVQKTTEMRGFPYGGAMRKGCMIRGQGRIDRARDSMNYHWADRNGWMYLCNCCPAIRIGDQVKHALAGRHRRTKVGLDRWPALGAK